MKTGIDCNVKMFSSYIYYSFVFLWFQPYFCLSFYLPLP